MHNSDRYDHREAATTTYAHHVCVLNTYHPNTAGTPSVTIVSKIACKKTSSHASHAINAANKEPWTSSHRRQQTDRIHEPTERRLVQGQPHVVVSRDEAETEVAHGDRSF